MEEGVNNQCGQACEEAAMDQVYWTIFFSVATKSIKVKAKRTENTVLLKRILKDYMETRKTIFNSSDQHSCTFFQALFIRYHILV